MTHQPADSVNLRVLIYWLFDRWNNSLDSTTDWLRDEFEQAVLEAIPSLQRMTTEVVDGVFAFTCETSDSDGSYSYGFKIDLFEDEDEPDEAEPLALRSAA